MSRDVWQLIQALRPQADNGLSSNHPIQMEHLTGDRDHDWSLIVARFSNSDLNLADCVPKGVTVTPVTIGSEPLAATEEKPSQVNRNDNRNKAGYCGYCGEWIGSSSPNGGRERKYCDNGGKCKQAAFRERNRNRQKAA